MFYVRRPAWNHSIDFTKLLLLIPIKWWLNRLRALSNWWEIKVRINGRGETRAQVLICKSAAVRLRSKGREERAWDGKLLSTDHQKSGLFPKAFPESSSTDSVLCPTNGCQHSHLLLFLRNMPFKDRNQLSAVASWASSSAGTLQCSVSTWARELVRTCLIREETEWPLNKMCSVVLATYISPLEIHSGH